jgi:hypothetical protein
MKWFFIIINIFSLFSFAGEFTKSELYLRESLWNTYKGEKLLLCRILSNGAQVDYIEKKIKVFFDEDSDEIKEEELKKIQHLIEHFPTGCLKIKLRAKADQCGDKAYNKQLALRRGEAVWAVMNGYVDSRIVDAEVVGEDESTDHAKHDKVVEIILQIYRPKKEFNEVVVVDGSGSLHRTNNGKTISGIPFSRLKGMNFKSDQIVFVALDANRGCKGTSLKNYEPIGDDFYNQAMEILTQFSKGKMKGKVYTDYDHFYNLRTRKKLKTLDPKRRLMWEIR